MACGAEPPLQWSRSRFWLAEAEVPTDQDANIHEAIYRSLWSTRGMKELTAHLSHRTWMPLAESHNAESRRGHLLDIVSIRERPAEAEDGPCSHGKVDLLTGANDTHIATLIERHSRFTMLVKLPRRSTTTVVLLAAKRVRKLPEDATFADVGPRQGDACSRSALRSPPMCRSTSATRAVPGSAAATETPTASSASTSKRNQLLAHLPAYLIRCPATQSTSAKTFGFECRSRSTTSGVALTGSSHTLEADIRPRSATSALGQ